MDETVSPASVRQWPGAHRAACRAAYAAVAVAGEDGPGMRLLHGWRGSQTRSVRNEVNTRGSSEGAWARARARARGGRGWISVRGVEPASSGRLPGGMSPDPNGRNHTHP